MKWEKFVLENEENSEYPMKNREIWAKTIVNIKRKFYKKIRPPRPSDKSRYIIKIIPIQYI